MSIRDAAITDTEEISNLVISSVLPHKEMDFDGHGWARFCDSNDFPTTQNRLTNSQYFTLCSVSEDCIVGIITLKNYEIVDQLYVSPSHQRKGVSRLLWDSATAICSDNGNTGLYLVKSSTYAIPIYQNFGFKANGRREPNNGAAYTRMRLG